MQRFVATKKNLLLPAKWARACFQLQDSRGADRIRRKALKRLAEIVVNGLSVQAKITSTAIFAPPNSASGISWPEWYVMVWPPGVETLTWRRSGFTIQNSFAPFSRQSFSLSKISATCWRATESP